jgi:hypothetical protein
LSIGQVTGVRAVVAEMGTLTPGTFVAVNVIVTLWAEGLMYFPPFP